MPRLQLAGFDFGVHVGPGAAERACHLLGSSRVVGDAMRRHPEFVDVLDSPVVEAQAQRLVAGTADGVVEALEAWLFVQPDAGRRWREARRLGVALVALATFLAPAFLFAN